MYQHTQPLKSFFSVLQMWKHFQPQHADVQMIKEIIINYCSFHLMSKSLGAILCFFKL